MANPYSHQQEYAGTQYGHTGYMPGQYDQEQYSQPNQYPQGGYSQGPVGTSYPPGISPQGYTLQQQQGQYGAQSAYFQPTSQQASTPQETQADQAVEMTEPRVAQQGAGYGQGAPVPDAFVSDLAAGVLRQQGENYFQRGQAFVQSKMGFLSSSNLQYHFNIDSSYVRDKLLLLLMPFLRQWSFTRKPEQISGGHKYQPPRQDTYAPDLYIPFMAVCTYVVLVSIVQTMGGRFTHDNVYVTVSSAFTAWSVHWFLIKVALYMLGIPSAIPFLEVLAYAGYPFVYACLGLMASIAGGLWPYRVVWVYGGLAMGTFMVRTMKNVLFHDSLHYSGASRLNYLLLGLAALQFPFLAWLSVKR